MFCVHTIANQNTTIVEMAISAVATIPIHFVFVSWDFRYRMPGQYLIAKNAIIGITMLKA